LTWLRSLDVPTFDAYAAWTGANVAGWLAGQGIAA
jgi:hypothetical protein